MGHNAKHPSESTGALSGLARPGVPPDRTDVLDGLRLGPTAFPGPAAARHLVLGEAISRAIRTGMGCAVLAIGPSDALAEAAVEAAGEARAPDLFTVDTEVVPELTHRLDPFAGLDPDALVRLFSSASPALADAGAATARRLLRAALAVGTSLRDQGILDLAPAYALDSLDIRRLMDFTSEDKYSQIPETARRAVASFLGSLPAFDEQRGYKQHAVPTQQAFHAPHAIAAGAVEWLGRDRWEAINAGGSADLSLPEAAGKGRCLTLRTASAPGEDEAAAFLLGCLSEVLRLRRDPEPLLVVVDGADAFRPELLRSVASLARPGIMLALGVDAAESPLIPLLGWSASYTGTSWHLPGGVRFDIKDGTGNRHPRGPVGRRTHDTTPVRPRAEGNGFPSFVIPDDYEFPDDPDRSSEASPQDGLAKAGGADWSSEPEAAARAAVAAAADRA